MIRNTELSRHGIILLQRSSLLISVWQLRTQLVSPYSEFNSYTQLLELGCCYMHLSPWVTFARSEDANCLTCIHGEKSAIYQANMRLFYVRTFD